MDEKPDVDALWSPTDLATLLRQLGTLETERLDFKRQPAHLKELIPAMAMTDGGLVVLGIQDDRAVYPGGCSLDQTTRDKIADVSRDVGVDVRVRELLVDGTPVVVVAVPAVRRRIVTTPDGRLLRRVGSRNTPLVGDRMARFVRERTKVAAEDDVIDDPEPSDFALDVINGALQRASRPPVDPTSVGRALVDLDVAVPQPGPAGPQLLVAAAVVFGVDPRTRVPGASVQLVRKTGVGPGTGPTTHREEMVGPLPELVDDCIDLVNRWTEQYQVVVGRERAVLPQYPEAALREALLNALAHRDYGLRGATVDITVWDDRLEIRSPGGLPGPITLENIRSEHYSRNRRIMRCLKLLGLVEEYGEGVDRMFEQMEQRLMEPPVISASATSVTVTLHNRFLVSIEDQAWLGMLGHLAVTGAERRLLAMARRDGSITPRAVRAAVPEMDAESALRSAVVKGLLVRSGERGGTRYRLSDEIIVRAGTTGLEAQNRKRQLLLDAAADRGSLSTAEGAQLLDESLTTTRHLLNDLVLTGDLIAAGRTRARRYSRP